RIGPRLQLVLRDLLASVDAWCARALPVLSCLLSCLLPCLLLSRLRWFACGRISLGHVYVSPTESCIQRHHHTYARRCPSAHCTAPRRLRGGEAALCYFSFAPQAEQKAALRRTLRPHDGHVVWVLLLVGVSALGSSLRWTLMLIVPGTKV